MFVLVFLCCDVLCRHMPCYGLIPALGDLLNVGKGWKSGWKVFRKVKADSRLRCLYVYGSKI
jgi:hypothetical protein